MRVASYSSLLAVFLAHAYHSQSKIIGIDLGSTYSSVAVYHNGKEEIIRNARGRTLTPTYIAWTQSGNVIFGEEAEAQSLLRPQNVVLGFKNLLAKDFADSTVQESLSQREYMIVELDGKPVIQIELDSGTKRFSIQEVASLFIVHMKRLAENYIGEQVTEAVLTIPPYFDLRQRRAIETAANSAGLKVKGVLVDAYAAILAGPRRACAMDRELDCVCDHQNFLVFHLGGLTTTAVLYEVTTGGFHRLAEEFDTGLGGLNLNQLLVSYLMDIAGLADNESTASKSVRKQIEGGIESAKRRLTKKDHASITVFDVDRGSTLNQTLTRKQLEQLNSDIFKRAIAVVDRIFTHSDYSVQDVDEVLLIGGSSRIPQIQDLIRKYFDGKQPYKSTIPPDEAVALGAAIIGKLRESENFEGCLASVI